MALEVTVSMGIEWRLLLFYCDYVPCGNDQKQDHSLIVHAQAPFQGQDLTAYRWLGSAYAEYTRIRQKAQAAMGIYASKIVVFIWCL